MKEFSFNKSLRVWFLGKMLLFVIPLFLMLMFMQTYMMHKLIQGTIDYSNMITDQYMGYFKDELKQIEQYSASFFQLNDDVTEILVSQNENELILAENHLSNKINKDLGTYQNMDLIMFAVERGDGWDYMTSSNSNISYREIQRLKEMVRQDDELAAANFWKVIYLDDKAYLVRSSGGNSYRCIIAKNMQPSYQKLAKQFNEGTVIFMTDATGKSIVPLTDKEEKILKEYLGQKEDIQYLKAEQIRYVVMAGKEDVGGMKIDVLMPYDNVVGGLKNILYVIGGMAIIFLLFLLGYWNTLHKKMIEPCAELCEAMNHLENDSYISIKPSMLNEIKAMLLGFNRMKSQIHELKIQSYEQKLKEQKITMQYLSTQIRPHFFLNTINIIYSLAQIRNFELIQKMSLSLVEYFRYTFKDASQQVTIDEELRHIENYLLIQKMRFLDNFEYQIIKEEMVGNKKILPFLLQTFVENSVKYGMDEEGKISIYISVGNDLEVKDNINIVISDYGVGFNQKELENELEEPGNDEGKHIGIWNAKQRLKLLYGDKAQIKLYNSKTGGAVCEISYPSE